MDKKELFEKRRIRLMELLYGELGANRTALAERLGISVSYVYRMLYPEGKAGKKNIGDDTVRLVAAKFNGYSLDGLKTVSTAGISELGLKVGISFDSLNLIEKNAVLSVLRGFGVQIENLPVENQTQVSIQKQTDLKKESSQSS